MTREAALAALLKQPAHAGVRRAQRGDAAAAEALAPGLGHAVFHIALDGCADKATLLARIAAALHFPDWFGHNWDALADCLADMSWQPAAGYVIFIDQVDRLPAAAAADFETALEIFAEAATVHARDARPMWILLDAGVAPPLAP